MLSKTEQLAATKTKLLLRQIITIRMIMIVIWIPMSLKLIIMTTTVALVQSTQPKFNSILSKLKKPSR